jgi:hypothetical protein
MTQSITGEFVQRSLMNASTFSPAMTLRALASSSTQVSVFQKSNVGPRREVRFKGPLNSSCFANPDAVNVLVLGSKIPRLPGDHFQYVGPSLASGVGSDLVGYGGG